MFGELLESRARPVRNRGGTVASVVGHAVFIALAVAVTRSPSFATRPAERVVPLPALQMPAPASPASPSVPQRTSTQTTALPMAPVLATVFTPTVFLDIPSPDLTVPPATAIGWATDGPDLRAGILSRDAAGTGDAISFAPSVDKPAIALSSNQRPRYPEILRRNNVTGEVVVQVVIDTSGRADMATLRVMSSTHPLLTDAVIDALSRARFLPAETGGRKVRMWAVQAFVFEVK